MISFAYIQLRVFYSYVFRDRYLTPTFRFKLLNPSIHLIVQDYSECTCADNSFIIPYKRKFSSTAFSKGAF